jgi:hypothetical protein
LRAAGPFLGPRVWTKMEGGRWLTYRTGKRGPTKSSGCGSMEATRCAVCWVKGDDIDELPIRHSVDV